MSAAPQPASGSLIAGTWIATGGSGFRAVDPATGADRPTRFAAAGAVEVDAAFAAAARAADAVAGLDPRWPARLLAAIADQVEALGDPLLSCAEAETGLARARLVAERARACAQLRRFAAVAAAGDWLEAAIDRGDPGRRPLPRPDLRRQLRPLGPIAVFDASNFPLAFGAAGGDTAAALAAGNPVVVKAHPAHPGTDALVAGAVLAALAREALPAGLFALLQGGDPALAAAVVDHPLAAAVAFTGSHRVGRALMDRAARRPCPVPVFAEMGSLNPVAITASALERRGAVIAEGLAASLLAGAGQLCTKPGAVLVESGPAAEAFADALAARLAAAPPQVLLSAAGRDRFVAAMAAAAAAPVVAAVAGVASGHAATGAWLLTADAATWRARPALREEAFGPGTVLVRCADRADLLRCLAVLPGQLAGAIHLGPADDAPAGAALLAAIADRAGRVVVDGFPTGVEVAEAMVHGGPYPASSAAGSTAVGPAAIRRFARPVAWQDVPDALLPPALRDANPLAIERRVDGVPSRAAIAR